MYNYHTNLILAIDAVLFMILVLLSIITALFAVIAEHLKNRRNRALLNIKRNVYELSLSGQKTSDKACLPVSAEITMRQFLDVATNRNREAVFFNEAEQEAFKNCFLSPEKISEIEKIAGRPRNKWRRINAILSLGYAEVHSAEKTLKKALYCKDEDIAYFSIIALGQIRTLTCAKILLDFLKKHKFYRYKIVSILESFPPDIADEVIKLTEDKDHSVRLWAIRLLSKLKAVQYIKKVEHLAADESEEVRAAACECLGALGSKEARDVLIRRLQDDLWLVRSQAIRALSKVMGKECLPDIIGKINDASLSVLESVKDVLIEHIDAAMPYLENVLSGKDEVAKRIAVEALEFSGRFLKTKKDNESRSGGT